MDGANRIKDYRKKRGMTQKQLGEALGKKQCTISQYESGKRTPDTTIASEIAKVLGTSMDLLFMS